jgi:hypothetical protein
LFGQLFLFFPISSMFSAFWRVSTLLESSFPIQLWGFPVIASTAPPAAARLGMMGELLALKSTDGGLDSAKKTVFLQGIYRLLEM